MKIWFLFRSKPKGLSRNFYSFFQKKESISDAESITNDYDAMGLSDGSSSFSNKSSTTAGDTDDEEMLDLLYDPCLNCYFDPKSGKYYELKNWWYFCHLRGR